MARKDVQGRMYVIAPQDFTTVMLRTVLNPKTAQKPILAGEFVDFLTRAAWSDTPREDYPFPGISRDPAASNAALRLIRMGPGLLVYLDELKKLRFLKEWENAILQP